jgi:hypothetical protein
MTNSVQPEPTAEEKDALQREAHVLLQLFLPAWLRVVVGRRAFAGGLRALLHALHQPRLNQHLLLNILDIMLLHLLQHSPLPSGQ